MGTGTINSKMRYLTSLKSKHQILDAKISDMIQSHLNENSIKKLKIEKLGIKEKIVMLESELDYISQQELLAQLTED